MEESGDGGLEVEADHTRRALEGDVNADEREPLNDLNTSGSGRPDYKPVTHAPDHGDERDWLAQTDPSSLVTDQPSYEDVARLEAEKDRIRLNNEAKDMVLDVIYSQVPEKIQKMLDVSIGTAKGDTGLQFSELSVMELKRLTKWLTEHRPFAELKESEVGT